MRAFLMAAVALMLMTAPSRAQDGSPIPDQSVSKDSTAATDTGTAGVSLSAPTDVKEAVKAGKEAVTAAKEGKWWYFSALVLTLLMFGLKFAGTKIGSWWPKLGRWRYVIVPVLSLAAALLAAFQGGVSFDTALGVFTSSYATASLEELWNHGLLGKAHSGG